MLGTIKKAMVAGAVVAVGALAGSAVASADTWSAGGAPYSGPAQFVGSLTMTTAGKQVTCPTVAKADLDNGAAGGVARGQVQAFLLGSATGYGACGTNLPSDCSVSLAAVAPMPWPVATSGSAVTFSGIQYYLTFSGTSCVWNGGALGVWGSMTGSVDVNDQSIVTFSNSAGLSSNLGAATVSGQLGVYVQDAAGHPDFTQPIALEP